MIAGGKSFFPIVKLPYNFFFKHLECEYAIWMCFTFYSILISGTRTQNCFLCYSGTWISMKMEGEKNLKEVENGPKNSQHCDGYQIRYQDSFFFTLLVGFFHSLTSQFCTQNFTKNKIGVFTISQPKLSNV